MNKSEESAKEQILNPPDNTNLAEITEAAHGDEKQFQVDDEPNSLLKYKYDRFELEHRRLEDENEQLRDVHELRKEYIPKLFWLTVGWLAFVCVMVWRVAANREFYLSDNVLIALITSTTVNVIGIFVIAARWLFPTKN